MEAGFQIQEIINKCIEQLKSEFEGSDDEFQKLLDTKLPNLLDDLSPIISKPLIKYYKVKLLKELRGKEKRFNDRLVKEYRSGLDYLQIFIDLNKYLGRQYLKELKKVIAKEDVLKTNILFRLHARACQVSTEIQTLIRSGFGDGAHARWRTLHEINVIFLILLDNDPIVSKMYHDYSCIDKLKQAYSFEKNHEEINWKPLDKAKIAALEFEKQECIKRYGKEFGGSYGWTMNFIEKKNERHFKMLEELADLGHLRPFYSWASESVHSGMDGILNRASFNEADDNSYMLFAGPSMFGLVDPTQFTTHSLFSMTSALISLNESLENRIVRDILEELHDKVAEEFIATRDRLRDK